jgi:phosphocarrier protein
MTLAAEQGCILILRFEGADEEEAAAAVVDLFEHGFGEE